MELKTRSNDSDGSMLRIVPQGTPGNRLSTQHYETLENSSEYTSPYDAAYDPYANPLDIVPEAGVYEIPLPLTATTQLATTNSDQISQAADAAGKT